jgi:hypothetical protein
LEKFRDNLQSMIDDVIRRSGRVVLIAAPYRFPDENKQRYVANALLLPDDDVVSLHQSYLDVVREFIGKNDVSVLAADLVFASLVTLLRCFATMGSTSRTEATASWERCSQSRSAAAPAGMGPPHPHCWIPRAVPL